jgi:RNA polymerase sigma-70 factor (ECF subfamily)
MIVYFNVLESEADQEFCQKLYEENRQKLFRIANKVLQNPDDAEDAVQTCFFKIINNFDDYRNTPYDELVIICQTIVKNNAIDIIREHKKKVQFTDEIHFGEDDVTNISSDMVDRLIEKHEKSLVLQAIMQLNEEERQLMYLQYIYERKPKEIAEELGLTSAAVRKKTLRCRNKLAKILEGYGYEG